MFMPTRRSLLRAYDVLPAESGLTRPIADAGQRGRPILILLFELFFLSGFCALAYQIAWQRMLGAFAGSDSVASTIIVGAFLFGLGIGSLLGASFADRISLRDALRAFALCELGVGIFACFSRNVFYDLFLGELADMARDPVVGSGIIIVALLPPTVLMGMSLPLLSRTVVDTIEGAATRIGWLYGLNTLGAAAGALFTGWILIGTFGFGVTVYAAAAINFLISATALLASGKLPSLRPSSADRIRMRQRSDSETRRRLLTWSLMVFVSGFLIISLEILWFRVLGTLMRTDAYAFSLILGVFLIGDGLGVVLGAEIAPGLTDPRGAFQLLQGLMGLYAILSVAGIYILDVYNALVTVAHDPGARYVVALTLPIVLPPALLIGMSFPITQRAIHDDPALVGRRVGFIQVCNILGNTAGAVVTGLVLLHWLGTTWTLRLIALGSAAFVLAALSEGSRRTRMGALAIALAAFTIVVPNNAAFWAALYGTTANAAIVSEDRTGIALLKRNATDSYGGRSEQPPHDTLYIAGHAQSRIPFLPVHGALGSLGAMLHTDPQDIFIIGQGTGGTPIAAGVNAKTRSIRVIDIVAPVFNVIEEAALRSGDDALHRPLRDYYSDPRFTRVIADARHVLLSEEKRYDIIEADAIYPTTALAGQLYSTEFFRLVLKRLKPGGYAVQWIPTERSRATFLRVFPYVVEVSKFAMIGSATPIDFSSERLNAALAAAGEWLAKMGWSRNDVAALLLDKRSQTWTPTDPREQGEVNTDLFPKDEYYRNSIKIDLIGEDLRLN
jgi:spermidine synthase